MHLNSSGTHIMVRSPSSFIKNILSPVSETKLSFSKKVTIKVIYARKNNLPIQTTVKNILILLTCFSFLINSTKKILVWIFPWSKSSWERDLNEMLVARPDKQIQPHFSVSKVVCKLNTFYSGMTYSKAVLWGLTALVTTFTGWPEIYHKQLDLRPEGNLYPSLSCESNSDK